MTDIEDILRAALQPTEMLLVDESHKHRNHLEALEHPGMGHFNLSIKSPLFNNKNTIECHRMIYSALGALMENTIHAISIKIIR